MIRRPLEFRRNRRLPDPAIAPIMAGITPAGPAGGDLGGQYPNPTVVSLANATVGPAVYPAGDGSLITGVPTPANFASGNGVLGGGGLLDFMASSNSVVAGWMDGAGTGRLIAHNFGAGNWRIESTDGAADDGQSVFWIGS